jgi:hypothetical protein
VTDDAPTIDLDAARAARAEKSGVARTFKLGGKTYALPAELPMEAILTVAEGLLDSMPNAEKVSAVRLALQAILGEHYDEVRTLLSAQDAGVLLTGVLELYGTSLPEARASELS